MNVQDASIWIPTTSKNLFPTLILTVTVTVTSKMDIHDGYCTIMEERARLGLYRTKSLARLT